jgi:transcriptional regulator with XRE-family HTH domain
MLIILTMNAKQISALRKKLGLTQSELARKLGVNRAAVCQWEHGSQTPLLMAVNFMRLLERLHQQGIDYDSLLDANGGQSGERKTKKTKEKK